MEEKLLSVLIPIYNDEKYLSLTLDSVLGGVAEGNRNLIEYIFINDGSTDTSHEILQDMQKKYKFKFITRENKGVMATSNELISLATGKYIYLIPPL